MEPYARLLLAAALIGACVPYPGELPDDGRGRSYTGIVEGAYPGLDAGYNEIQALHFAVKAYGVDAVRSAADRAEEAYNRIMTDTGLYSFKPRGLYQCVVYGTQDEYRKKTGQPDWSAGVAVGNALYTFLSPKLEGVLSHEMTHLIWFEFMGGRLVQEQRWVNEGLAVYEESKALDPQGRSERFSSLHQLLRSQPIPMEQMMRLVPATERAYDVSLWYAQAESMVRFMIQRGGRIGFSQFLLALRDGKDFDRATAEGFPGQWRALADFEMEWRRSLQ
ncbi:MAG TPA: hypothetical protein DCZ01_07465 [Elusimicrobia bacterium]|nr:MAG: hypothetical protein A2X37_06500 [Elusimicrobia bacterium GWA2_66_18]OGR72334.1 MAG: hypothetical protein A2X40_07020 [Elusimicrobia bacterium GWC2_65_9]HAZ08343.1 hypothetical protein [Elusimicrobiota bacterium]